MFNWRSRTKQPHLRNKAPTIQYLQSPDIFHQYIFQDKYIPLHEHPDVMIGVNTIADLVSNMSIHLMENTAKGDMRVQNELSRKIDIEPCQNMTRKAWVYKIVQDLLITGDGNSIVHIEYDSENDLIRNLTPFDMRQVTYAIGREGYVIEYQGVKYSPDEVIHFVLKPDPYHYWKGVGYRVMLADVTKNLSMAMQTKRDFLGNKNMPSLIVKVDASTGQFETKEGRQAISDKYLETSSANEPWIIPADLLDVVQVKPMTLKDIAINESVEIDKKTVAGILGIPAFYLGVGDFNKEEHRHFINTKIMSIAQVIAQTLTRDILISPNWYFRFNPRSLFSYDLNELTEAGSKLVQLNAMRRNELRDWLGLVPDDEMEDLIVLENYLPQDKLGDQKKLKGGETD